MTSIFVAGTSMKVMADQGWHTTEKAVNRRMMQQAVADHDRDMAATVTAGRNKDGVAEYEQYLAELAALTAAGINDPTIPEVGLPDWMQPQEQLHDYFDRVFKGAGAVEVQPSQPDLFRALGVSVWLVAHNARRLPAEEGHEFKPQRGWFSCELDAQKACDEENSCTRAGHAAYIDSLQYAEHNAAAAQERTLRDWNTLAAAGLTPSFDKPVPAVIDRPNFDEWYARRLKTAASARQWHYPVKVSYAGDDQTCKPKPVPNLTTPKNEELAA